MTADRWWVRWGARWLARAEAVAPMVRVGMLTMTGLSTALVALKQYGHGRYALPLVIVVALGTLIFTWLYTEGGVFNQKNRDKTDMGTNWAGPNMRMQYEIAAVGFFAAMENRPPTDEEHAVISEAVDETWRDFRDGVDLNGHSSPEITTDTSKESSNA